MCSISTIGCREADKSDLWGCIIFFLQIAGNKSSFGNLVVRSLFNQFNQTKISIRQKSNLDNCQNFSKLSQGAVIVGDGLKLQRKCVLSRNSEVVPSRAIFSLQIWNIFATVFIIVKYVLLQEIMKIKCGPKVDLHETNLGR